MAELFRVTVVRLCEKEGHEFLTKETYRAEGDEIGYLLAKALELFAARVDQEVADIVEHCITDEPLHVERFPGQRKAQEMLFEAACMIRDGWSCHDRPAPKD